jgi:alanine racemase
MAVVKANGYGHGLVPTARILAAAGADALMVVTVDEALTIRDAGIDLPVLNFGPYDSDAAEELVRRGIEQSVFTREAIEGMAAAAETVGPEAGSAGPEARSAGQGARSAGQGARSAGQGARSAGQGARQTMQAAAAVHVMIDTGLGRVGVPHTRAMEILQAAARTPNLRLAGTLSTLTEDPDFDREQFHRFEAVCDEARAEGIELGARHVLSSAGVLDFPEAALDMVRPGIMLYGHYPNERSRVGRPIELQPVLALKAKVAYVKTLQRGESVGYLRAYTARSAEKVATLPIGHSEGYPPTAVAGGGHVWIHDRGCPLVGEVTSNHLEVRVPDDLEVEIGDTATLITAEPNVDPRGRQAGPPPNADILGEWSGLSVYGLLMRLNPLLPLRLI